LDWSIFLGLCLFILYGKVIGFLKEGPVLLELVVNSLLLIYFID